MTRRRLAEIAFLLLVPALLCLALSEAFLRIYLTRNIFYDVEMSRYALELKIDSPNPLIAHHHRPSAELHAMGVMLRTNADGFRDDPVAVERDERRRILFLGDSLTLGWGVEKQQTFEHRLEEMLSAERPTEVLNLGVGNYNTTQELNLLIDKGLKYAPDQVVLFYFINDAEPVPVMFGMPGLGRLRTVTFYWSRIKALRARLSPGEGYESYYHGLYREDAEGWRGTRVALDQLARVAAEAGFDLRVVLLPDLHELQDYPFAKEHAMVAQHLLGLGVPVLDLAPAFSDVDDPLSLWVSFDDAHPNARAHAMIARASYEFIAAGTRGASPERAIREAKAESR